MFKYIYDLCERYNCIINATICPDGGTKITCYGKYIDYIIIEASWEESLIKDIILDLVKRCDDNCKEMEFKYEDFFAESIVSDLTKKDKND